MSKKVITGVYSKGYTSSVSEKDTVEYMQYVRCYPDRVYLSLVDNLWYYCIKDTKTHVAFPTPEFFDMKPVSLKEVANLRKNKAEKSTEIVAGKGLSGGGTLDNKRITMEITTKSPAIKITEDGIDINTSSSVTSDSETDVANSKAVKKVNDKLSNEVSELNKNKVNKTGDTMTGTLVIDADNNNIHLKSKGERVGQLFTNTGAITLWNDTSQNYISLKNNGDALFYANNLGTNSKEVIGAINELEYRKFSTRKMLNNVDCNELLEDGLYCGYEGLKNAAISTISVTDVKNYTNDWVIQKQYPMLNDGKYREYARVKYDGRVWSNWLEMWHTGNLDLQNLPPITIESSVGNHVILKRSGELKGSLTANQDGIALYNEKSKKMIELRDNGDAVIPANNLNGCDKEIIKNLNVGSSQWITGDPIENFDEMKKAGWYLTHYTAKGRPTNEWGVANIIYENGAISSGIKHTLWISNQTAGNIFHKISKDGAFSKDWVRMANENDIDKLKSEVDTKVSKSGDTINGHLTVTNNLNVDNITIETNAYTCATRYSINGDYKAYIGYTGGDTNAIEIENRKSGKQLLLKDDGTSQYPANNLKTSSKEVVSAINELHDGKVSKSGDTMTGILNIITNNDNALKIISNGVEHELFPNGRYGAGINLMNGVTSRRLWLGDNGETHLDANNLKTSSKEVVGAINELNNGKEPAFSKKSGFNLDKSDSVTSNSSNTLATSVAVKTAYDKASQAQSTADGKVSKSGDTMTGDLDIKTGENETNVRLRHKNGSYGTVTKQEDRLLLWNAQSSRALTLFDSGDVLIPANNLITNNKEVVSAINELNSKIASHCPYNIGDIYITTNSGNPSTTWLGTTWEKIEGRFLLGSSGSGASKQTGGSMSKTIAQANLPATKIQLEAFNLSRGTMDITGHMFGCYNPDSTPYGGAFYKEGGNYVGVQGTSGGRGLTRFQASRSWTGTTNTVKPQTVNLGSGQALDITPSYYTTHIWLRTE